MSKPIQKPVLDEFTDLVAKHQQLIQHVKIWTYDKGASFDIYAPGTPQSVVLAPAPCDRCDELNRILDLLKPRFEALTMERDTLAAKVRELEAEIQALRKTSL